MKIFSPAAVLKTAKQNGAGMFHPRSALALAASLLLASCAQTPSSPEASANPGSARDLNIADAAIADGDPSMALSVSQSILKTDADNVDALVHEGDAYYALDRCPPAEAAYKLALERDPKAAAAETGLGRCLLKTDPHDAEIAFEQAVQDDPGNAAALNDLGIARDLQGNFAGAVDPYNRALLANPALTAAEVNLGLSLALSGHGPEALQYLGPLATSTSATPKIREDYAVALLASGRTAEAKQVLSVDLTPDQMNAALSGYSTLIADSQQNPPPPPPPGPTAATVQTTAVAATPLTPAPAAPTPLAQAAIASGASVQLGALNSPVDAERAWRGITNKEPTLFSGKEPQIVPVNVSGKTFYRLRVSGFGNTADAAKFCAQVTAAGNVCTIADF
jgi:Flp pilus assembly protein TadD